MVRILKDEGSLPPLGTGAEESAPASAVSNTTENADLDNRQSGYKSVKAWVLIALVVMLALGVWAFGAAFLYVVPFGIMALLFIGLFAGAAPGLFR